jgi:2Fe-2S ferredoxin
MPVVVYVRSDGSEARVEVAAGENLMFGAVNNNVKGIDGECGGCLSCATCHVYIDDAFRDRLPQPEEFELELLEGVAAERKPNSRLGCQITVTPELDGIVVGIPERQS